MYICIHVAPHVTSTAYAAVDIWQQHSAPSRAHTGVDIWQRRHAPAPRLQSAYFPKLGVRTPIALAICGDKGRQVY